MKSIVLSISLAILLVISVSFNIMQLDRNKLAQVIAKEDAVVLQNQDSQASVGENIPVVDVGELCDAFSANKESAQKEYASRFIILSGTVEKGAVNLSQGTTIFGKTETSISFSYKPAARKTGWFDYDTVVCSMLAGQSDLLKELKIGDKIKLKGLVNGSMGKTITIDGCVILK